MNEHQTSADLTTEVAALRARVAELEEHLALRDAADVQQTYYAEIVENVHDAVIAVDSRFRIVTWNAAAVSLYGWSVAEARGRSVADVIHEVEYLDGSTREEALHVVTRDGLWSGEVVQQDRYGRKIIVDSIVRLTRNSDGSVHSLVAVNRNVTARKQAEAAQRESEGRYRQMFEGNLAVKLLVDARSTMIVDANSAACVFYGYERAALLETSLDQLSVTPCPRDLSEHAEIGDPGLARRSRHRLASGEVRDVEMYAGPVDVGGQRLIYIIIHDITERIEAERLLRENERRLRLALTAARMGVWEWVIATDALEMTAEHQRFLIGTGLPHFEGDLANFWQYIHPDERAQVIGAFQRSASEGSDLDIEHRLLLPDQPVQWLTSKGIVVRDEQGRAVRMIGTTVNITERKQVELSVRESEANLRAIFESSQHVIILLDAAYRIKAFNGYAQAIYGRAGYLLQLGSSMLECMGPEYRAGFQERFQATLGGSSQRVERLVAAPSGDEWWEFSYNPIVLDDGQVTGVTCIAQNIDERVRAEQRLRDSAARLRLLIDQIPALLWTLDRDARITSLVGTGVDDTLAVDQRPIAAMWDVLPDGTAEFVPPAMHQQALSGVSASYEIEWRGCVFQCHVEPFLDRAGAIIGTIGLGVDVTERVRARQLQEGQRHFFEALATGVPLADVLSALALTIEQQIDGGICSVLLADESQQMLHHSAAPSLPADFVRVIGSVAVDPAGGSCGAAAFCGEPVIVTDIATDPRWITVREDALLHNLRACWSTPFHDNQGALLGTFAIYYRQPRSPTPAELNHLSNAAHLAAVAVERTRTEAALRDREELYRLITENSGELISLIDQNGNFLYASPSYAQMLGYDPAGLRTRSFFDLVHLDDLPLMMGEWSQVAARRTLQSTARLRHTDGSWRWIDVHGSVIRRGACFQVVCVGRDVTERMRAEVERRRLEDHLVQAQKMESIGTLTGGIAHDFNNVLSVILGNAQLALLQNTPDDPDRPLLEEIEEAATRGSALTRQLLAFSRRQRLERQVIDLNRTIGDLSLMLRRIIGKDVEIVMNLAANVASIVADPIQIEQILLNLAVNARDALPEGGRLEIATSMLLLEIALPPYEWAAPGRYVQVVVRDNGVGMDAETQQRVFEPFFTTKAQGKGTGLGLAVVYGIVKQHEGFIRVTSAPHEGTAFTILFPAEASDPARDAAVTLPHVRGGTETILVVEDEPPLRRLVRATLQQLGYTVLLAEDGQSGVELFKANADRIDLVILDLIMPRLAGRAALAQMRALRPDLRALLVSGYDNSAVPPSAIDSAAPPLLAKPYRLDALTRMVRDLLDTPDHS